MLETPSAILTLPATSVHEVLLNQARNYPQRVAVEFGDRKIRYGEVAVCARRFASGLRKLGVEPGDRVGLMMPNRPEFLFAFYGTLMAGGTVVLYSVMLTPPEIEYLANDSGTKVLVVQDDLVPKVLEGAGELDSLEQLVVIGEATPPALSFDGILDHGEPDFEPVATTPDTLAMLIYTSGTTGKPKGAMLTHSNILHNLASIHEMRASHEGAKVLCVLPLFHVFGLVALLNVSIMRGDTLFLHPRFEIESVIDALKTKGITHFSGTPTMFFHVLNHPDSHEATFPDLVRCGAGGAPLPLEIRKNFRERFGVDITEGYGMSETTVSISGYPDGMPIKSGSVGMPIPGVEMKIVDEDLNELRFFDIGEILVRGPNIMAGYWQKPEETGKALRDGWLHTGDLGYIDDQGFVFIVDRKKDMIIKGGYNIYPREIEEVVYELPEIDMAAVIGVPDMAKGETVHVLVSIKQGREIEATAIEDHLKKKLSKYKLPQSIRILDEIPTGPTGKILKRELRNRWEEIAKDAT